jgi:hypothetical protein
VAPLSPGQALNVALFSYDGGLYWGLNADWDALPDLDRLARHLDGAFAELERAAGAAIPSAPAGPRRRARSRGPSSEGTA